MKKRTLLLMAISGICLLAVSLGLTVKVQAQSSTTPKISNQSTPFNGSQKKEIERIIGEYLRNNPEIIIESIRNMQARDRQQEQQRGRKNLVTYREMIFNDPTSPVGGNPKGDVTIVEFFDYNCSFCKRVFPIVKKLLEEDKNIRYVFKEFPILSPQSELAARAALAAWRQDKSKYVQLHTEFIKSRGGFTESRIMRMAKSLGLNTEQLKKDMSSAKISQIINGNRALAQRLGITGTPGFIIGNQIYPGAADMATFKNLVAQARKG
ncbi:MAG: DsbA family protein [Rhodospirillaceae bacterium]|jgi:protein-disulfide isomerase|nr:DsbA family protein [Rhodospirillaceae bacterium]MBT7957547.1 DsbA family protein [Rhodospirillaceae bacterium]